MKIEEGEAIRQTLRSGLLRGPPGCGTASSLVVPCFFIPRGLCSCCLFSREYSPLSCVRAQSLQSCLTLCEPVDRSPQAPLSIRFSRQEYWSGLLRPSSRGSS